MKEGPVYSVERQLPTGEMQPAVSLICGVRFYFPSSVANLINIELEGGDVWEKGSEGGKKGGWLWLQDARESIYGHTQKEQKETLNT